MLDLSTIAGLGQLTFAALSYFNVGPQKVRDFALSTTRRQITAGALCITGLATIGYGYLPGSAAKPGVQQQVAAPTVTTAPVRPPFIDPPLEAQGQAPERPPVKLAQAKQAPAKDATRPSIEQRTYGPNSPNFLGDNNRFTIVNPEVNPYAPVITYDFEGNRRETAPGINKLKTGALEGVFKEMVRLHDERNWPALKVVAEKQFAETPEWLTPALFSGLAHAQVGEIDMAITRLEHVERRSGGNAAYADAARIREAIRQRTGR